MLTKLTNYHTIDYTKTLSPELSTFSFPAISASRVGPVENLPFKVALANGGRDLILLDYIAISEHFRISITPLSQILAF